MGQTGGPTFILYLVISVIDAYAINNGYNYTLAIDLKRLHWIGEEKGNTTKSQCQCSTDSRWGPRTQKPDPSRLYSRLWNLERPGLIARSKWPNSRRPRIAVISELTHFTMTTTVSVRLHIFTYSRSIILRILSPCPMMGVIANRKSCANILSQGSKPVMIW